ncbi:MAG: hypothetical protein LBR55_03025 [Bacteroidales bacterium]|jgi:hypothetical protein|nr:hypothetical protein [Bacteroidales bacterium]
MTRGKQTCKILKQIRTQIAAKNDIKYITMECGFQGECKGTCPKCEEEVRYLEQELRKRRQLGKIVTIAGISLGVVGTCAAQVPNNNRILEAPNLQTEQAFKTPKNDSLIEVSGKVLSPDGEALIGTFVREEGTNNGIVVLNEDGSWSLSVQNESSVLVFESSFYITQERTVGSERNFLVTMQPDEGEVTIMGFVEISKTTKRSARASKKKDKN